MSHIQLILKLLMLWSFYQEINNKNSSIGPKRSYLKKKLGITREGLFSQTSVKWVISVTNININCFAPQNEPRTVDLGFSSISMHFRRILTKKTLNQSRKRLSQKEDRIYPGRTFYPQTSMKLLITCRKEFWTSSEFIANLVFCNIFVRNWLKQTLWGKKWLPQK